MSRVLRLSYLLSAVLVLCHCGQSLTSGGPPPGTWPKQVPEIVSFERDIKPMLELHCVQCHNSVDAQQNANLNLETRKLALTTGRQAPVIKPGDPANSLLVRVLELDVDHPTSMPPSPDKIWGVRMQILKRWIAQGADWPVHIRLKRPQDWAE